MKRLVIKLFGFELIQRKWGRKWIKGTFYLIDASSLRMGPFWSDEPITSCQSKILKQETYV